MFTTRNKLNVHLKFKTQTPQWVMRGILVSQACGGRCGALDRTVWLCSAAAGCCAIALLVQRLVAIAQRDSSLAVVCIIECSKPRPTSSICAKLQPPTPAYWQPYAYTHMHAYTVPLQRCCVHAQQLQAGPLTCCGEQACKDLHSRCIPLLPARHAQLDVITVTEQAAQQKVQGPAPVPDTP
jgi:hypothetical protein